MYMRDCSLLLLLRPLASQLFCSFERLVRKTGRRSPLLRISAFEVVRTSFWTCATVEGVSCVRDIVLLIDGSGVEDKAYFCVGSNQNLVPPQCSPRRLERWRSSHRRRACIPEEKDAFDPSTFLFSISGPYHGRLGSPLVLDVRSGC
jgi:hypothetical protein